MYLRRELAHDGGNGLKVFISWSGSPARELAEAIRIWLQDVLQSITPFVSFEDIEKGRRWANEVAVELESSNYGIICVVGKNVDNPWLNFEAGALSKSIAQGLVSPILFDAKPSSVTGPLTQFQFTQYERADMRKLIGEMNQLTENPLDSSRLDSAFNRCWTELDEKVQRYLVSGEISGLIRKPDEMVAEILTIVRQQQLDAAWSSSNTGYGSPYVDEILSLLRTQERLLSQISSARDNVRSTPLAVEQLRVNQMSVTVGRLLAAVEHAATLGNVGIGKFVQIRGLVEMLLSELRPSLDMTVVDFERRDWKP